MGICDQLRRWHCLVHHTAAHTVVGAPLNVGNKPYGITTSPDGSILYIATDTGTTIFDARSRVWISSIWAGDTNARRAAAVSVDGLNIYTTNVTDDMVKTTYIVRGNTAPVSTGAPTVAEPQGPIGAVTGSVSFTDPDGDWLTYGVSSEPTSSIITGIPLGSVTFTSGGGFTFTPTPAARDARCTAGTDTATFTVRAADAIGGFKDVPVTVNIVAPAVHPVTVTSITPIAVGSHPIDMTVAGNRLFVLNSGDGSVSVIDTTTNKVVSTITGVGYASPMAASGYGRYLYMSQYDSYYTTASVKVVDTTTGRVVKTVVMPRCETEGCDLPGGGWANSAGVTDIAISPDNSRVYVSAEFGWATRRRRHRDDDRHDHQFSHRVDVNHNGATSTRTSRCHQTVRGSTPRVVTRITRNMDVLDARTLALVDTVRLNKLLGWPPVSTASLTFSPNGERAYARLTEIWPDYTSQTFAVIDTKPGSSTYNEQIATITVPSGAQYLAVSADNTRAYVVHSGGQFVTVIDLSTNTVVGTIASEQTGWRLRGTRCRPERHAVLHELRAKYAVYAATAGTPQVV